MRLRITKMRHVHETALKHGVSPADITHVLRHPIRGILQDDGSRLYLGAATNAELLEVITLPRTDGSEIAIHAMKMRPRYATLLPRE
jgi:hypothetical protein